MEEKQEGEDMKENRPVEEEEENRKKNKKKKEKKSRRKIHLVEY